MRTNMPLSPDALGPVHKILVIQLAPFGDVLLTTAYFQALKTRFPDAELHYLVKAPYQKAVSRHPLIDKLHIIPSATGYRYMLARFRQIHQLRRERFDLVIDQQAKPSSMLISLLSGARIRLGWADASLVFGYNLRGQRRQPRYSPSMRFDMLSPLGINESPYEITFPIPAEDQQFIDQWLKENSLEQGFVTISPGANIPKKRWNPESYAAVADFIQQTLETPVVLIWAPGEEESIETVQRVMQSTPVIAPRTSLEQAAALLTRSRLLLCNDGGLNHFAVSTHTPTLAIFGNTNANLWSPAAVFPTHHHLAKPGDWRNDDTFGIEPAEVSEKVQQLLESH